MDGSSQADTDRRDRHQGTSAADGGGNYVLYVLLC